jgi:predicted nucleotidyltransferase
MNSTLLDLSKKVDSSIVDGVAAVSTAAQRLRISFLIVGAAARDFLLECACGIVSGRATLDVDFGVRVNSWEEYEKLAKELEDSEGVVRDTKIWHRFQAPNSLLIDLVPFGPISGTTHQITWPPDDDRGISVEGFESVMTVSEEM